MYQGRPVRPDAFWNEVEELFGGEQAMFLQLNYEDGLIRGNDLDRRIAHRRIMSPAERNRQNRDFHQRMAEGEAEAVRRQAAEEAQQQALAQRAEQAAQEVDEHAAWIRGEIADPEITLNIWNAPHLGELRFNLSNRANGINIEDYKDGDELVMLQGNPLFSFRPDSLQEWFKTHTTNPSTSLPITQADIQRFTYVEDLTIPKLGGRRNRRNRKSRRKNKRKTRRH